MKLIHYTSLEGLYGIISTKKIRLTDSRYLNDSSEIKEGISKLGKAMEKLSFSSTINRQLKTAYEIVEQELREFEFFSDQDDPFYLCSFSQSADLLSQWRSYGPFAIEFCSDSLKNDGFDLFNCIYYQDDKKRLALQQAAKLLKEISEKYLRKGEFGIDYLDSVSEFTNLSVTFKHEGFKEEQEIRCAERIGSDLNQVHFNTSGNLLKPFIEREFSFESIRAIHIGPTNNKLLAKNSISMLLEKVSDNLEHEVDIIESELPFRG